MSMNILITAERKVSFKKKNGKRSGGIQTVEFGAWQTPTKTTKEILASSDPAQAYIDWILTECSLDQGTPVFNLGKEHAERFREWLTMVEEDGFTVKFEMV